MSEIGDNFFVYAVQNKETEEDDHYLSFLPTEIGFHHGLPNEAIMGIFTDGADFIDREHFQQNTLFINFLHEVIASHASDCPSLIAEAKRQQEGSVFVIDGRSATLPSDAMPTEDVIGAAGVQAGNVTGYRDNPNYRVWTKAGLMVLDPWFMSKLLDEARKLAVAGG